MIAWITGSLGLFVLFVAVGIVQLGVFVTLMILSVVIAVILAGVVWVCMVVANLRSMFAGRRFG